MESEEIIILLIEDDVDWAKSYVEDAEEYTNAEIIYVIPPRELVELSSITEQSNAKAVVLDELLQQNSDASYLGVDALNYLSSVFPNLPLVIITEYPPGPELKEIPSGLIYRKRDLDDHEVKKRHFQELMNAIDIYVGKKVAIEQQFAKLKETTEPTEETIKQIAQLHFLMDDAIEEIVWFPNEKRKEPQLLEVNRMVLPTGHFYPFLIQASDEINIPLLVGDVTPLEWQKIREAAIELPDGWDLENFRLFEREETLKEE